ncbi:PepSY domain-containing protein [Rhodospirillum sp. A1_3_36]|uniref:PepSY domain-containing protein n=1 Tax=Rhodospirillum sp. A1_3_36 TaxID=3391666 RepID=UPI0039A4CC28
MSNKSIYPLQGPIRVPALILTLALTLGPALLISGPAWADGDDHDHDHDHDRARAALRRGDILPLTEILERIQTQVPGRFLEVELEGKHDTLIYDIKIMDDRGRITRLDVDAATGAILKRRVGGHD